MNVSLITIKKLVNWLDIEFILDTKGKELKDFLNFNEYTMKTDLEFYFYNRAIG